MDKDNKQMGDDLDKSVGVICILVGIALAGYTTRDFVATAGIFLAFFTGYGYLHNGRRS